MALHGMRRLVVVILLAGMGVGVATTPQHASAQKAVKVCQYQTCKPSAR